MNRETIACLNFQFSLVRRRAGLTGARRFLGMALGLVLALTSGSSSAQNRVLELDGNGSYVELPPNIFRHLTEATVEVWAKWDRLNSYARVFEFGGSWQSMSLFNHGVTSDLRFNLYPRYAKDQASLMFTARANGVLRSNEWTHIAAVSGPGGMKLYVNGELLAMHTNDTCLAAVNVEQMNLLGRGLARNPHDQDFRGQIDEVRVWNYGRSAHEIRENMNRRVSGREPGLVGLWNFDDGLATDASPRGNHGKLMGNARAVTPALPAALQLIAAELIPAAAPAGAAAPLAVTAPAPANRDALYWWIAAALTVIVVLLGWLAFLLKRNHAPANAAVALASPAPVKLPPAETGGSGDVKERALAELAEFAKQSLVQGLYSQRNALLETQQKAHRELAELEARLAALKIPDRILAYEKRIAELERELDTRAGELRELTNTTLTLLRRKVEEERELERATRRFN